MPAVSMALVRAIHMQDPAAARLLLFRTWPPLPPQSELMDSDDEFSSSDSDSLASTPRHKRRARDAAEEKKEADEDGAALPGAVNDADEGGGGDGDGDGDGDASGDEGGEKKEEKAAEAEDDAEEEFGPGRYDGDGSVVVNVNRIDPRIDLKRRISNNPSGPTSVTQALAAGQLSDEAQ